MKTPRIGIDASGNAGISTLKIGSLPLRDYGAYKRLLYLEAIGPFISLAKRKRGDDFSEDDG